MDTSEFILYVLTFSVKLVLDGIAITLFIQSFSFFYKEKKSAMKYNGKKFSLFNKFILGSIIFLLLMRAIGSLYTFLVGVVSLTDYYNSKGSVTIRLIMGEEVFPVRDCLELLFFSYLFIYSSKRKE